MHTILTCTCPRCKQNAIKEQLYDTETILCYHCGYKYSLSLMLERSTTILSAGVINIVHNKDKGESQIIICETDQELADLTNKFEHGYFPLPIEEAFVTLWEDKNLKMIYLK